MPMSGPEGTGKRTLDVHSPIKAHARQKSKEYCRHVPFRGVSAKPDCIQSVFSSGLSSLQVRDRFRNSPILSQKAKAKLEASSLYSSSVIEPGELLRRSDQAFQSKRGG